MKKLIVILVFLSLSAGLLLMLPAALSAPDEREQPFLILRVWNADEEPAVHSWLRSQAKAFERETGRRVYLRAVSGDTLDAAGTALPPDALIRPDGEWLLALRGYALILRDENASVTPAPTGALFFRPSLTPDPTAVPLPWPEENELRAVLCPEALMNVLPGAISSVHPAADLTQGKADAAVLTPGQAAGLSMGWRAYAIPEGKGFLPVRATAYSGEGEAFLAWLRGDAAQQALGQAGLFSPRLRLYSSDDPVRHLIENSLFTEN